MGEKHASQWSLVSNIYSPPSATQKMRRDLPTGAKCYLSLHRCALFTGSGTPHMYKAIVYDIGFNDTGVRSGLMTRRSLKPVTVQ